MPRGFGSNSGVGGSGSYHPPLWLSGEHQHHQRRFRSRGRHFVLEIPTVDTCTYEAIAARIRLQEPHLVERAAWDQALRRVDEARRAVEEAEENLARTKQEGQQAIQDLTEEGQEQLEDALKKMERQMRTKHEKEQKELDDQMHREIRAEQAAKRKEQKQQHQEQPPSKRLKSNHSSESSEQQEDAEDNSNDDVSIDDSVSMEDGELEDKTQNDESKPPQKLQSEIKAEELKKIENEMESYKETKSQMVWLLRQVITAENKRKLQMKKAEGK